MVYHLKTMIQCSNRHNQFSLVYTTKRVQDRKCLQLLETISFYLYNYVLLINDSIISCRWIFRPNLFLHVLSTSIFWSTIQAHWSLLTEFRQEMTALFLPPACEGGGGAIPHTPIAPCRKFNKFCHLRGNQ